MKNVVVFGAGKSATHLIDYLLENAESENWQVIVADASYDMAAKKIGSHPRGKAMGLDILNDEARKKQIKSADIVISMLPAFLHGKVAEDCVVAGKNMLTASYVDDHIKSLQSAIEEKGLLFLCEMGLDPGIDHMSAMEMLDEVREQGGKITGFRSHCGGLVAPESDDNPWHYKISWNPRNIILAGKAGAHFRESGKDVHLSHRDLFTDNRLVSIPNLEELSWYPNRDSLSYESLYGLHNTPGFVRTTLRHPGFMNGWGKIIDLKLTEESPVYDTRGKSFGEVLTHHFEHFQIDPSTIVKAAPFASQWKFLELENISVPVNRDQCTPAELLQAACERKLALQPTDKDLVVMLHELEYVVNNKPHYWRASLVVTGEDSVHTAMSKTVGLPLAIACRLILNGTIQMKGLHIPVVKEIYEPVLAELATRGVQFIHSKNQG